MNSEVGTCIYAAMSAYIENSMDFFADFLKMRSRSEDFLVVMLRPPLLLFFSIISHTAGLVNPNLVEEEISTILKTERS